MANKKRPLVLTELDLALLQGLADGKTVGDLVAELAVSTQTLRWRIIFIKRVLPAKNLTNLVAEAIRKEYID